MQRKDYGLKAPNDLSYCMVYPDLNGSVALNATADQRRFSKQKPGVCRREDKISLSWAPDFDISHAHILNVSGRASLQNLVCLRDAPGDRRGLRHHRRFLRRSQHVRCHARSHTFSFYILTKHYSIIQIQQKHHLLLCITHMRKVPHFQS